MTPVPLPRSFRMRLMLLSVSLSAAILLGFGYWTWQLLDRYTGQDRLDREMLGLARNQLGVAQRPGGWRAFEDALEHLGELDPSRVFAFAVLGSDGTEHYRSGKWPDTLDPGTLERGSAAQFPPPPDRIPFERPPAEGRRGWRDDNMRRGDGRGPRPGPLQVVDGGLRTHEVGDGSWRVAIQYNPFETLILTADLAPYYAETHAARQAFLSLLMAALVAIGTGGWFLAHRAMKPVDELIATAESITAQALEQRIPESGEALEFARLNRVINEMLERLERSFKQATRFSADAAHELKTPLTILQGQLNQLLQEAPPGSALQQSLGRLLEEVQRLTVIIRKLLLLSLADAGRIQVHLAPLALEELLETMLEDLDVLAPELQVRHEFAPGIVVLADESLLRQAVQNLINNAIKYNVPQGKIRVELFRHEGNVRFSVANTSRGIPEEERKRVFHRFYRADPAHSRNVDGVGLGLSLAREIVRSHGGKLWLADAPEGWVQFVMELPEAEESPDRP